MSNTNTNERTLVQLGLATLARELGASDGDVVQIDSDGNVTIAAASGGSIPFTIAQGEGVPGFDFEDTYDVGAIYQDTTFSGLYLKTRFDFDVSAACPDPNVLPNLGITKWCRISGDNNGWPVPGISVDSGGSVHYDSIPGHASFLSDLMAFSGSGNGVWWNWIGSAVDGEQDLVAQVGPNGSHIVRLANPDGSLGPVPGGIKFPTSDPHIAGVWWDNAGTLTKSSG